MIDPQSHPKEYVQQLQLALSILSRRVSAFSLTPDQFQLLRLDFTTVHNPQEEALTLEACEDVIAESILAALPTPAPVIDLWEVAVSLLREIARCPGGIMPANQVRNDPDFIDQLIREGVVVKTLNGLRWGRNAPIAIGRYDAEQVGTPRPVPPMPPVRQARANASDWDS